MPRIRPADIGQVHNGAASGIETMETLFQTMAHRPELAQQAIQLTETAMRSGTVDARLKELLAIRVSQVNHCFY